MKRAWAPRWLRSLRWRLLAATLVAVAVALVLAGVLLAGLFRDHVTRQFSQALTAQLDQITARLEFDASGQPQIDPQGLSDPRWSRPYSGLYWQVDGEQLAQCGTPPSCCRATPWPMAGCTCTRSPDRAAHGCCWWSAPSRAATCSPRRGG